MNQTQLLDLLLSYFNDKDLRELSFRLEIPYEDLSGDNRREKAISLLEMCRTHGRMPDLFTEMGSMRPHLPIGDEADRLRWIDDLTAGMGQVNQPQITSQTNKLKGIIPPTQRTPTPKPRPAGANPYYAGRMVTDKTLFFGREEERLRLRTRLQNGGSSAIVGLRRIGKSSLLYYLSHHEPFDAKWQLVFAYLDLQDARYHTLPGLLNAALAHWYSALGSAAPQVKTLAAFNQAVQTLNENGLRLALCLDEFEQLTKRPAEFSDDVFESWRALGNAGYLAFLTASHQPLADLIKQGGLTSNFDNIFTQIDLGLLDETSALALVREPAQQQGVVLPDTAVNDVLRLGGTHPFYLQMASHHLFNNLQMGRYRAAQVRQDFLNEAEPYWRRLWDELLPMQQTLLTEAIQPNPPLVIERQYRRLARSGVLRESAGAYQPFSETFGSWLDEELKVAKALNQQPDAVAVQSTWKDKLRNLLGREDR
ncbi:MAG: ATP-binding protein [Ardenticatenaceae bacterium]|nr:ATP-binding protein [Anaerolineales bacterium]MCB8920471.1 ATP-binding protein [Ardenticatenaceae bacterium]MCB8989426.1 ATP-binding protein [Ardenticatenaceae bacterium]